MKRHIFSCMIAIAAIVANAMPPITIEQLVDIATYHYITLENESEDAQAVIDHYDKILTDGGFTHGLTGDGYGGPCSIIDGYYIGGHVDTEQYCFVPDTPALAAVIEIAACNDGDEGDYGFPNVSLNVFTADVADDLLNQLDERYGWEEKEFNVSDDFEVTATYVRDNVTVEISATENNYHFFISATD